MIGLKLSVRAPVVATGGQDGNYDNRAEVCFEFIHAALLPAR